MSDAGTKPKRPWSEAETTPKRYRHEPNTTPKHPLQLSFKKGHGVGFYEFYEFFPFRIFIKTSKVWEIWRYRRARWNPREKLHRMGWVPIHLTFVDFCRSLFGLFFITKSSYFKPGNLGKSPEDLWESFLKIWLWSGTYNLSIYPEYVRKPSVIFPKNQTCFLNLSGKIICLKWVFRPYSGNFPN